MSIDDDAQREMQKIRRQHAEMTETAMNVFVGQLASIALVNAKADATREVCDKLFALLPPEAQASFDVEQEIASLREAKLEDFLLRFEAEDSGFAAAIQAFVETDPTMKKIWERTHRKNDDGES